LIKSGIIWYVLQELKKRIMQWFKNGLSPSINHGKNSQFPSCFFFKS